MRIITLHQVPFGVFHLTPNSIEYVQEMWSITAKCETETESAFAPSIVRAAFLSETADPSKERNREQRKESTFSAVIVDADENVYAQYPVYSGQAPHAIHLGTYFTSAYYISNKEYQLSTENFIQDIVKARLNTRLNKSSYAVRIESIVASGTSKSKTLSVVHLASNGHLTGARVKVTQYEEDGTARSLKQPLFFNANRNAERCLNPLNVEKTYDEVATPYQGLTHALIQYLKTSKCKTIATINNTQIEINPEEN